VFVGGLHRSGTTLLARTLARHPMVSGLSDTGVVEDEGQHLQDVYARDVVSGGPGEFAFDPAAHVTEDSPLVNDAAREGLLRAWSPYWHTERPVLVEKSPPNVIKTRLLAALFPDAYFVIVMRHPVVAALATSKWVRWWIRLRHPLRLRRLIAHWLRSYELFLDDAEHLRPERVMLVRYEDLVQRPDALLARVFSFLGLPPEAIDAGIRPRVSEGYFARWRGRPWNVLGRAYRRQMIHTFEPRTRRFGYSLSSPEAVAEPDPRVRKLLGDD
jgi:hypothetical protein